MVRSESGPVKVAGATPWSVSKPHHVLADFIRDMLGRPYAQQVVIANAHTLNLAYEDPTYREQLCRASLILRDGVN